MSANESETGSPASRLREAEKQIVLAARQLPDVQELQMDLESAEEIVGNLAEAIEERESA